MRLCNVTVNTRRTHRFLLLLVALLAPGMAQAATSKSSKGTPAHNHVLPFIADDYEKALQMARAKKLPLFIENWAPW